MGFLTTVTFYNDGLGDIEKNKGEFAEQILQGMNEAGLDSKAVDKSVGCHGNALRVQPSRHADNHVLFLHWGNMVHAMGQYEKDWDDLCKRNPECAKKMLDTAKEIVKSAEKALKKEKSAVNELYGNRNF